VFRIGPETALVQTLDFFTPIVDSPYSFGQIAAANALSDVYAMGGRPLTAMNIVCFPKDSLSKDVLRQTLRGGLDKVHEAGAVLVGGHSVDDREFKYGLSVTGVVHPDRILTNKGARQKDLLILTKPIGTGVLATAVKAKMAGKEAEDALVSVAAALNGEAARIMAGHRPRACTDVTGFGLAGHLFEMARASNVEITVFASEIPFIPQAVELAGMGLLPGGAYATRAWCEKHFVIDPQIDRAVVDLAFDPQTSGGLLISLSPKDARACAKAMAGEGIRAAVIGEVTGPRPRGLVRLAR
jgi:selenide,water dikinase